MLQDIRDNMQGVIAKIIIGLIVITFALFGIDSIFGGVTEQPALEINGDEISERIFIYMTRVYFTAYFSTCYEVWKI